MRDFSLQLSPLFWLVCTLIGLGAVLFVAFFCVVAWLLIRRIRVRGFARYSGAALLLGLLVLNGSVAFFYVANELCATASFRADRNGISWPNWTRRHAHSWAEVKSLTIKRNLKGGELLEIRAAKNANETESFEIDASNVSNFAALTKWMEKSTRLFVKRPK